MVFALSEVIRAFAGAARSVRSERGAVSAEYAALLVFLALAVITGLTVFAVAVVQMFRSAADGF